MKIAYINSYWTPVITGGQRVDVMICDALSESFGKVEYIYNDLKYNEIKSKFYLVLKSLSLFKRAKFQDVCLVNSSDAFYLLPLVIIMKVFTKTKIVNIHHHYIYMNLSGFAKYRYYIAETIFLKICDTILTVSSYIEDLTNKLFPDKRVVLCQIPFEHKEKPCYRKEHNSLLFVGTVDERKGLKYLIEALSILQKKNIPFILRIVGKFNEQSAYYQALCERISNDKLNVVFTGCLSNNELQSLYEKSEIFSFPSLHEGFGMVLVEAMSYGLPVVCFNNSAMPYTIKDGFNGLVAENKTVEKFSDCLEKLLTDKNLCEQLAKNAYQSSLTFPTLQEFNQCVQNLIATYGKE